MLGTHDLWLFVVSGLLLNITPGPDTLYIVGRSTAQGVKGGATAALGIGAGALVHICAAALGLSALLSASAAAFTLIKVVGASYLIYVGVSMIRAKQPAAPASGVVLPQASLRTIFFQGFFTNVLNPKVALFFLAFLPQFVAADAPSKPIAFLFLGIIFDTNGTLWNLLVAWSTARLSARLGASRGFTQWFNRCIGSIFVALGVRLVLAPSR